MANITELLAKSKALKAKQAEIRLAMKAQKVAIVKEYTSNMDEATKQAQIKEATSILENARADMLKARDVFKATAKEIRAKVATAKEILEFVGWKDNNAMPKVKNSIELKGSIATIQRGEITVSVDTKSADWQKTLIKALEGKGVDNGAGRNIAYKVSCAVKASA